MKAMSDDIIFETLELALYTRMIGILTRWLKSSLLPWLRKPRTTRATTIYRWYCTSFWPKDICLTRPPQPSSYCTVYDNGVYHTPLGRFSILNISTVRIASVSKRPELETSRPELSEDVSFGIGTLLVVERSSLENRPRGA